MKQLLFLAILAAGRAYGQAGPTHFEVASIKPAPPPGGPMSNTYGCVGGPGAPNPGLYRCYNSSVASMTSQAYGLKPYQMKGSAYQNDKDLFSVEAKVPAGATKEDLRLMMQDLLTERFRLAFHYDKKEVPAYDLSVARNGLQIKESALESSESRTPTSAGMLKDADGFRVPGPGMKGLFVGRLNGLIRLTGHQQTMEGLVSSLTALLHDPVFDTTGLTGKYDLSVTFTQDSVGETPPPGDPAGGLTIFAAFQKELGLSLAPKKHTVDMFIIDHVDKTAYQN